VSRRGTGGRPARLAGVALAVVAAACTVPPPGGDPGTTTTSEATSTSTSSPTTTPSTTTTSEPTTTTTTAPPPRMDQSFTVTVAGAFGTAVFDRTNSQVVVSQSNQVGHQELEVAIQDPTGLPEMFFKFASRKESNEILEVGYYGDAQRWPFNDPGWPGIAIHSLGFCNDQSGNFEVRDIGRDGPAITRIWITYQRYCDGDRPAYGELRLGYPAPAYAVAPQVVRWPEAEPTRQSLDVPVVVRPTSADPVQVTGVSVAGTHAADFPVRADGCSGVVGTGGCVVLVGFAPQAPGRRHAELQVATSAGTTRVSLDGRGALGRSDWVVDIDSADPTRPDEHLELAYSNAWGGPYEFSSGAFGDDGIVWNARFYQNPAARFEEGQYVYGPDGTGLQMNLSRGNDACEIDQATVDIADLGFAGPDELVDLVDLAMVVECRYNPGHTARVRIRYHDRDDLTAPGTVTGVSTARDGDRVVLRWTNPAAADLAGVIVRGYAGAVAPGAPDVGEALHVGGGTSATINAPGTAPLAVSIWAFDQTGNVGPPYELQVSP
jgi:hypothetical protein